ncbi:MAG: BtrH N-terminal domain-containing protein [Desulfuromonadaceae bacterium]|nr:BtrH N-terminal domain-containing protein [Desulfuromonadaceae bacterium]
MSEWLAPNSFQHRQYAHCESGAVAGLLNHAGLPLSEALVFGLGGGLFFGYVPFVKLNGFPLMTYRCYPGGIFKRVTHSLRCPVVQKRYRHPQQAMAELDRLLEQGHVVGLQTSVFWLPYIPAALRFHFNAHNLLVIGKEGSRYRISDPVVSDLTWCEEEDLCRARFARGALAPKGRCYYLQGPPQVTDLRPALVHGMQVVCRDMLAPIPVGGIRGMRFMACAMEQWEQRYGVRKARYCLAQLIRMQEEIGTGGGGFRFIYAAFLQEAAVQLHCEKLEALSDRLTAIGDAWREFALSAARCCKGRDETVTYHSLGQQVLDCANQEDALFRELRETTRTLKHQLKGL